MGWTIYNYHSFDELLKLLEREDTQMSFAKELKKLADAGNAKRAEDAKKRRVEKFFDDLKKTMLRLAKEDGVYVCKFSTPSDFNIISIRDKMNDWGLLILQMRPEDTGHYFEVSWS